MRFFRNKKQKAQTESQKLFRFDFLNGSKQKKIIINSQTGLEQTNWATWWRQKASQQAGSRMAVMQ